MCPSSPYQAGIWCPHQSWRETHHGSIFSSHWKYVFSQFSGTNLVPPLAHGIERAVGQRLHVHVPLVGEVWLDHDAGAVAVRHHVGVRLDLRQIAALLEHGDDPLARLEAVEVVERQDGREVVAMPQARA